MSNKNETDFFVYMGVAMVPFGIFLIFAVPDSSRSPRGLSPDVLGWLMIGIAVLGFIFAYRRERR